MSQTNKFSCPYVAVDSPVTMPAIDHAPCLLGQGDIPLAKKPTRASEPCHTYNRLDIQVKSKKPGF